MKSIKQTETLLIVDDNPHNRALLSRQLVNFGFNVITAETGSSAIEYINSQAIDLVLLDIIMPDIDGYEVLSTIRDRYSAVQLPVIMTTSLSESEDVIKALNLGANDYISKPLQPKVAVARIRTHLNMKSVIAERDKLLDMTSHDIRKPVILINDILNTIKEEHPDQFSGQSDLGEMLNLIHNTSNRLYSFVSDLLEMRVIENGRLELNKNRHDINDVISEVIIQQAKHADEKMISILHHPDKRIPSIYFDKDRILQVMDNLVSNAIKYSPTRKKIQISTEYDGAHVYCRVFDQGPGIRAEEMPRLFQRFSKLSNKPTANETSTGLGLSICKELIELHNGNIGAENNSTGGSQFWFALPT